MSHRIEAQVSTCPAGIGACRCQTARSKSLSDKQDNSERLPNDPVLKVKNTKPGERKETKKREQLIAPFHEGDVGAHPLPCQRKNRLSTFLIIGKVRHICRTQSCSSFGMVGALIPAVGRSAKEMETQRFSRGRRFTTRSTGMIQAVNRAPAEPMSVCRMGEWAMRELDILTWVRGG